jgi:hypothetical protein
MKPKIHMKVKKPSDAAKKIAVHIELDANQSQKVRFFLRWFCRPDDGSKIQHKEDARYELDPKATKMMDKEFDVTTKGIYVVTLLAYHPGETFVRGHLRNHVHKPVYIKFG